MRVTRIAWTYTDPFALREATDGQYDAYAGNNDKTPLLEADMLAEFAGRACYQSWDRPNPKTARNADYIASAVHEKQHESITAHASAAYYITGVSRALTHEMIRHRFLAFSEMSQRYVDIKHIDAVAPPALKAEGLEDDVYVNNIEAGWIYKDLTEVLVQRGYTRKQAREAARAVLPNSMETRIVVSGNLRAWRDFIKQRWSVHADAEIRELAGLILSDLRQIAPNTFADIPETPYE